ncbi:MAG: Gfo/Idh/MocA family oxidoreductase [Verrucomicrobiae bacterium]|nr:Gfo/Idh/MocA family oxidoreductase [Verrucomicrobiae bacterium]
MGGILAAAEPGAPRIRLAFLGAGHSHFQGKLEAALESGAFEVIGVHEGEAAVRARHRPAVPWIPFEELVARAEVVVVESEVARHAEDARRALEAGKHVHVEKPPADTLAALDTLVALAAERRRVFQVGYMWRHHPGLAAMEEAVRDGRLGEVFLVRATMNTLAGAESRREWAAFAGGAMFEQGCHLVDFVVRLLGRPDRVTPFLQRLGMPGDDLADNTLAVLEYPRALALITSAPRQPGAGAHRCVEVTGTRGLARLQPVEPPVLGFDLAPGDRIPPVGMVGVDLPPYRRYVGELQALAAAVRGEAPLPVTAGVERIVQETVLRASGMA